MLSMGDNLFAIVQEYDTMDSASEQMEAHRKYIDVPIHDTPELNWWDMQY